MSKIGIYYIVTDEYKHFFSDFLESVQNFMPNDEKTVMLISDGLKEYNNYYKNNVKVNLCPAINHYPWPIITLYKTWHILQNWDDTFDYVCYFNANSIINIHNNVFDLNKVNVSYHSFNDSSHNYDPWYAININKQSSAYLDNKTYEYVQGGFFYGKAELIKKMCEDVNKMLWNDTQRHLFAQWHDESYINKWCVLNKNIVNINYYMSVFKNAINTTTFIYLQNKGKLVDDIKIKNLAH